MTNELVLLISRLADLQSRATEISERTRRDVERLVEVQREMSQALERLRGLDRPSAPPAVMPPHPAVRILRKKEVSKRVGLCGSSLWRLVKDGLFPAPRRLSPGAVGWLEAEVDEWLKTREATGRHPDHPITAGRRLRGRPRRGGAA